MKEKFQKLLKKHKISRDSYYKSNPYEGTIHKNTQAEITLLENFAHRVGKGWYGISLSQPTPNSWFLFMTDFLRLIEKNNPDFEIQQIKIKFGGIRIYLSKISKETQKLISIAENELFDKHLIY